MAESEKKTKGKAKASRAAPAQGTPTEPKRNSAAAKKAAVKKAAKRAPKDTSHPGTAWATLRHVRIAPQKLRLMLNLIKGRQVDVAIQVLRFAPKKSAAITLKLLQSAISNAKENHKLDVDKLWVVGGEVSMGRTMKRYMPRAQGRATPIRKRSSHITVVVGER